MVPYVSFFECPYGSLWVLLGSYACLCVLMDSNGSL